jgi:hypothetical protein
MNGPFLITLPSSVKSNPRNRPDSYETALAQHISLNRGEWEAGLHVITYPESWNHLGTEVTFFAAIVHKTVGVMPKGGKNILEHNALAYLTYVITRNPLKTCHLTLTTGDYVDAGSFTRALEQQLQSELSTDFKITFEDKTAKLEFNFPDHTLFLFSTHDCKLFDILGIRERRHIIETYDICVMELELTEPIVSDVVPWWPPSDTSILVMSDIVEHTSVGDGQQPVLARIPVRRGSTAWWSQPTFFVKLARTEIDKILIWITSENGERLPAPGESSERVVCQLAMRPRRSI